MAEDLSYDDYVPEDDEVETLGLVQLPEDEWFNEYGLNDYTIIQAQVPDFNDYELWQMESVADDDDLVEISTIDAENQATATDIPAEWVYWESNVDPSVYENLPSAPPERGDVDPETGELVP